MRSARREQRRADASGDLYAFDSAWISERSGPLAGADEAGRGALAGPIYAAATVLREGDVIFGLDDSKALSEEARESIFREVVGAVRAISVVCYPAWWIDRHGVGAANRDALRRALQNLSSVSGCSLADGNLKLGPAVECLPRADGRSAAVAAASIVAKVLRDGAMSALAGRHPDYGFERNRGYGTQAHRASLREAGPCRVHRLSYAGVVPANL